jgi:DNA-binding MarR family transcriptional regulator
MSDQILDALSDLIRCMNKTAEEFRFEGLQPGQSLLIIEYIASVKHCDMKEISQKLNLTPSTATRQIDKLVEQEIVVRSEAKDDRRRVLLELTALGMQISKAYRTQKAKALRPVLRGFSEEDRGLFADFLEKIAYALCTAHD